MHFFQSIEWPYAIKISLVGLVLGLLGTQLLGLHQQAANSRHWAEITTVRAPANCFATDPTYDNATYRKNRKMPVVEMSSAIGLTAHLGGEHGWVDGWDPCREDAHERLVAVVHDGRNHRTIYVPCDGMVYVVPVGPSGDVDPQAWAHP